MTADHDPSFRRWTEVQRPPLPGHPHALARVEHTALQHELAAVDAQLEVLAARRRAAVAGLRRLRPKLWAATERRHGRRPHRVDEPPMPPVPDDAVPVCGVDLRTACLGILRRHGACSLRELHGLLHRHGYAVRSSRPVQRLADAMAYEVRQGRCARLERGVYVAVAAEEPRGRRRRRESVASLAEPLPWSDPDADDARVDPVVVDDPERWSGGGWPPPGGGGDEAEEGSAPTGPAGRYPPSRLDREVHRARERCAHLAAERRHGPDLDHPTAPDPTDPFDSPWERFVDDSFPMVGIWAGRRREWWRRIEELAQVRLPPIDWPDRAGTTDEGEPEDDVRGG